MQIKLISEEKNECMLRKDEGKEGGGERKEEDMNFLFQFDFDLSLHKACNMLGWIMVFCQNSILNCKYDNRKYLIGQWLFKLVTVGTHLFQVYFIAINDFVHYFYVT